jgi:prepilin-type N-terminal cleavage/methylation domain-containing protein
MKKNSAFSLIEISIVILVIGILIAGITQSSRLVKESGLMSARSLTQSSPVSGIKDLMSWHETSLKTSFDSNAQIDGSTISTWYDNGKQSTTQNNAIQIGVDDLKPLFKEYIFDGAIPAVRFDGSNDYLSISREISEDFTIITVFKTTGGATGAVTNWNWYDGAGIVDADVIGPANDFGLTIKSGRILAGTGGNSDTTIYNDGSYNDGRAHMVFLQEPNLVEL